MRALGHPIVERLKRAAVGYSPAALDTGEEAATTSPIMTEAVRVLVDRREVPDRHYLTTQARRQTWR